MTVASAPDRRGLYVRSAVGLACVAVVVIGLWLAAGYAGAHGASTSTDTTTNATVTASASCQGSDTQDSVSFRLDGASHQAKLDGCGHQRGEVIAVLVPSDFTNDTALEPTDAAPGNSSGLSHRVAFVLLIIATVVGGAFAYRFRRTRRAEPARGAPATSRKIKTVGRAAPAKAVSRSTLNREAMEEQEQDREPDEDYHSDIRPVPRDLDPEATGVDWFEDSETGLPIVPPPADRSERADRS